MPYDFRATPYDEVILMLVDAPLHPIALRDYHAIATRFEFHVATRSVFEEVEKGRALLLKLLQLAFQELAVLLCRIQIS